MIDRSRLETLGARAANEINDGMIVGLGTGSTADAMIQSLGQRVAAGLSVTGVTTSMNTSKLAQSLNIPLVSIDAVDVIDVCIDGADEIDPQLNVVKGRGGAILWEKLTARLALRYIIIASSEKLVSRLGTRMALPVEIIPYGWKHTCLELEPIGLRPVLRLTSSGNPFVTDGGHYIVDCETDGIDDVRELAIAIKSLTGVVEHGLFVDMVDLALTIDASGDILETSRPS